MHQHTAFNFDASTNEQTDNSNAFEVFVFFFYFLRICVKKKGSIIFKGMLTAGIIYPTTLQLMSVMAQFEEKIEHKIKQTKNKIKINV